MASRWRAPLLAGFLAQERENRSDVCGDLLVGEIPTVLRTEVSAVAALIGAAVVVVNLGLSPIRALRPATSVAAELLRRDDVAELARQARGLGWR